MADLAVSVAFGRDWHGKKTKATKDCWSVMYFALERADLARRRIDAQIKQLGLVHDPATHGNIFVVSSTINLFSPESVKKVVRTVKNAEALRAISLAS